MKINKGNMAARAAQAAVMSPSLTDRFAHAREFSDTNPADMSATAPPTPVAATSSVGTPQYVTRLVPLDQIDTNPFNARKLYRPERVNELAASIGAHGQETPGMATQRNGRYVLVAGHYRLRALRMLNNRPMLLTIRPDLSDRELYEMSYRENAEREGQTTLDNALSWRELLDAGLYRSETEISEATGISLSSINKTLSALKLSDSTMAVVRELPTGFGISVLYEIVLYEAQAGPDKAAEIARSVAAGETSRKDIQTARERLMTPVPERKRKETSRTYKIQHDGKEIGSLKTWDSGKVSFEVILGDVKERQALIAELQQRFGLVE